MPKKERTITMSHLFLTSLVVFLLVAGAFAATPTETALYNFAPGATGSNPYAAVVDSSGNLYGTTGEGGNSTNCNLGSGCGTVFMLTPPSGSNTTWTQSVLYSFQGKSKNDGSSPQGGVVFDSKGALYGTTASGGKYGDGTVFKLTPPATKGGDWTETVLYSFKGGIDGSNPASGLIFDSAGALYGTTPVGGLRNFGTVFELAPNAKGTAWTESILYTFRGLSDGGKPYAGLTFKSGVLYGTTLDGGLHSQGGVFELSPPTKSGGAWTATVIYSFSGGSDGGKPYAGVIFNASGSLFSTTGAGGAGGYGTVFSLTPPKKSGAKWTESVLYSFGGGPDGAYARSGLIFDKSGNLYSTTGVGSTNAGVVFELSPPASGGAWTESVLWTFSGGTDGGNSTAGLALIGSTLYGTTTLGGEYGKGVVFQVIP